MCTHTQGKCGLIFSAKMGNHHESIFLTTSKWFSKWEKELVFYFKSQRWRSSQDPACARSVLSSSTSSQALLFILLKTWDGVLLSCLGRAWTNIVLHDPSKEVAIQACTTRFNNFSAAIGGNKSARWSAYRLLPTLCTRQEPAAHHPAPLTVILPKSKSPLVRLSIQPLLSEQLR